MAGLTAMVNDHFLNLQPGTIVNGRYEVVKCLGTGSMGLVYACKHRELAGHLVAMKVLFSEVARDEVAAARFRNEIVASYGVSHPNVVRAYEYFRDGDLIAFTMEFIGGGDLADKINTPEPISIRDIVRMLFQMASGMQAIHEAGIIHRDLKPENILLTPQGDIKITDFGIARMHTGQRLTEHGGIVGTIDYVSPEYLEQGNVDARSDIYAFGVIAYEMITREPPFKGKSVIEAMTMRLRSDPAAPQTIRADCPPDLGVIVLKAMARDPNSRYQSAGEICDDIRPLMERYGLLSGGSMASASIASASAHPPAAAMAAAHVEEAPAAGRGRPALPPDLRYGERQQGAAPADVRYQGAPLRTGFSRFTAQAAEEHLGDPEELRRRDEQLGGQPDWWDRSYRYDSALLSRSLSRGAAQAEEDPEPAPAVPEGYHSAAKISVSHSRLSAERINQLSTDLFDGVETEGVLARLFPWLIMLLLGFGIGLFIVSQYRPEVFERSSIEEMFR